MYRDFHKELISDDERALFPDDLQKHVVISDIVAFHGCIARIRNPKGGVEYMKFDFAYSTACSSALGVSPMFIFL